MVPAPPPGRPRPAPIRRPRSSRRSTATGPHRSRRAKNQKQLEQVKLEYFGDLTHEFQDFATSAARTIQAVPHPNEVARRLTTAAAGLASEYARGSWRGDEPQGTGVGYRDLRRSGLVARGLPDDHQAEGFLASERSAEVLIAGESLANESEAI
jgi:hypothetical protein